MVLRCPTCGSTIVVYVKATGSCYGPPGARHPEVMLVDDESWRSSSD